MGIKFSSSQYSEMNYLKNYSSMKLSTNIPQENTHYIIIMRHGERQDCDEKPTLIKNDDDPELSSIGIQQALDIGHQLKLNLLGINFSEINVFTSPFTRTIQTGLNTANGFDVNDGINKNIYIIKDLAENGYKDGFEKNIDKGPIYYGKNEKNYKKLYKDLILPYYEGKKYIWNNFDFESKLKEVENEEEIKDRYYTVIENLYNYINNKIINNNGNSLNIITSHQYGVSFMMEKVISILNGKNEEKINFEFNKQNYFFCCTYCFKITKEKNFKYLGLITPNILRNDPVIIKDDNNKMLDPRKRNNRFLVVMRHGERIDNNSDLRKNQELPKFDPELTSEGMLQAINVGAQLRNLLRYKYNIEINEINIFNSPSSRTMQTGILAAGGMDYLDKVEKVIRIITDLNETSVEGGFENNKRESPIYYYKDKDQNLNNLYNKYIDSLIKDRNYRYSKMDFSSILGKEALEDAETMKKRAENVITNIKGFIETTFTKDNNTLSIVATHQLNVSMIVEFLINEINKERTEKNLDKIQLNEQSFGYCCCFIFKIDDNNEFSYLGLLNPNIFDSFEYNLI